MKRQIKRLQSKSGYPIGTLASAFTHYRLAHQEEIVELSILSGLPQEVCDRFANASIKVRRQAFIDIRQRTTRVYER